MTGHRIALLSFAPIALGGVLSAASLQAPGVRPVAGQGEEIEVLTGEKIERAAIVMTDSFGDAFFTIDYNQPPMSSGNGTIVDGMEFNFQYWFRDPRTGSNFNLSDGLRTVFCP